MPTCPQGHLSQADDYCDTCGEPMTAPDSRESAGNGAGGLLDLSGLDGGGEPEAVACPTCGVPAAPGALFCENCGYDFTTGTAPAHLEAPAADPGAGQGAEGEPEAAVEFDESAEAAEFDESAEAAEVEAAEVELAGAVESEAAESSEAEGEEPAGDESGSEEAEAPEESEESEESEAPEESEESAVEDPAADAAAAQAGAGEGASSSSSIAGGVAPSTPERVWVAELWVDPDWYALQRPEDAMPSAAAPVVVALRRPSVLIGRPSRSRGITPDVDCGADAGVSRRHAQLTTDGLRWWVEDLGSANGTYVSPVGGAIPDRPVPAGERIELEEGSRIYLGGWTRIVVREALPGEA